MTDLSNDSGDKSPEHVCWGWHMCTHVSDLHPDSLFVLVMHEEELIGISV